MSSLPGETYLATSVKVPAGMHAVDGIANFGWVERGKLARGEQPREDWGGYRALREVGITCVLSLREGEERENVVAGRPFPAYKAAEEGAACRAHGLRFRHIPLRDRAIPAPEALAAALGAIEAEVAAGQVVYIHCMAGIGRTGLLATLWLLARGAGGDAACRHFIDYWLEFGPREEALVGPLPDHVLERYGFPLQWWALLRLAELFARPATSVFDGARPQAPDDAAEWQAGCRRCLAAWREEAGAGLCACPRVPAPVSAPCLSPCP